MVTETQCPPRLTFDEKVQSRDDGRSLGSLFRSIIDDTRALFRQELRLARCEITEKAAKAARNSASIGIGAGVALAGAIALVAAACTAVWAALISAEVSNLIAVWLAPLIVGAVITLIGYSMIKKGTHTLKTMSIVPEKTTESLKETGRWMQEKVS